MFSNEKRESVKADNPGISFTDIGRKLGEMWREMDPDVKKEYETRAMTAKDKYMLEKKAYLDIKDKRDLDEAASNWGKSSPGGEVGHIGMMRSANSVHAGQTASGEHGQHGEHKDANGKI